MATPHVAAPPDEPALEQFGYRQELDRSLSFTDLVVYGLIFMVPIAPFGIFGFVYAASGGMVALAYAIGMVAMIFTALSYAQMVRAFPMAGSVYSYAGRGIAPPVGFLAGWAILLDYVLIPSLLYIIASIAMHATVPEVPVAVWLVAFVVLNTVINFFGIRLAAAVIRVMLLLELLVLAAFLVIGVVALADGKGRGFSFDPFFNGDTFSTKLIFGAVAIAVLSFLGFDAISTLAEENRGEARQIGRAMAAALVLAGLLFVAQTWVASLLVTDPDGLIASGDPGGTAFYDAAATAGGTGLKTLTTVATAISWGFANALVAQVATSRLLFAMARDRQLPSFLARVSPKHSVPVNAVFTVAVITLGIGLYAALGRDDGPTLLTNLVNFGALSAFIALHLAVIYHYLVRRRSRNLWLHLVAPLIGVAILGYVLFNSQQLARGLGLIWLGIGAVVLIGLYVTGRRPKLSGLTHE